MSSEALEAIRRRHAAPASGPWDTSRGTLSGYVTQARVDVLALLAEVARLEQERDAKAEAADNWHEAYYTEHAALAVAREREQPMREALEAVAAGFEAFYRHNGRERLSHGLHELLNCERLVRAALVDEPAAAASSAWSAGSDFAQPAAATLAEPGEETRGTA